MDCVETIMFFYMKSVYRSKLITLFNKLYTYNILA